MSTLQTEKIAIIASLILILAASSSGVQNVLHVEVEYNYGNISIQNIDVAEGYPPNIVDNSGPYTLRLTGEKGNSVKSRSFDFNRDISRGGKLNQTQKTLSFTYSTEIKTAVLYKNYTKVENLSVPAQANIEQDKIGSEEQKKPFLIILTALATILIVRMLYHRNKNYN